jgi:hypothetical protein
MNAECSCHGVMTRGPLGQCLVHGIAVLVEVIEVTGVPKPGRAHGKVFGRKPPGFPSE